MFLIRLDGIPVPVSTTTRAYPNNLSNDSTVILSKGHKFKVSVEVQFKGKA
jgi:hypothetical protein